MHAFNEPRWFFAALGALKAGWTVSGIYTTNTYEQAAHIIRTSGVRVLVLESTKQLTTTYQSVFTDFPALKVVLLDASPSSKVRPALAYDSFVRKGRRALAHHGIIVKCRLARLHLWNHW